jgi:hypothetical protein
MGYRFSRLIRLMMTLQMVSFSADLLSAMSNYTLSDARADREFWGRLVESAVGTHLANAALAGDCKLHYWRAGNHEVDFIVQAGRRLTAIEVKSGRAPMAHAGTAAFAQAFQPQRCLLVGGDGLTLGIFTPQSEWQIGLALTKTEAAFHQWQGRNDDLAKNAGLAVVRDEAGGVTRYELRLPLAALGLKPGDDFRFDPVVSDDDDGFGQAYQVQMGPGLHFLLAQ